MLPSIIIFQLIVLCAANSLLLMCNFTKELKNFQHLKFLTFLIKNVNVNALKSKGKVRLGYLFGVAVRHVWIWSHWIT